MQGLRGGYVKKLFCFSFAFFGFGARFVDTCDHVKVGFDEIIMFTLKHFFERTNCILKLHVLTRVTCKDFRNMEWL